MGKPQGWMCVRDPAPAPELVQQIWRAGDPNPKPKPKPKPKASPNPKPKP